MHFVAKYAIFAKRCSFSAPCNFYSEPLMNFAHFEARFAKISLFAKIIDFAHFHILGYFSDFERKVNILVNSLNIAFLLISPKVPEIANAEVDLAAQKIGSEARRGDFYPCRPLFREKCFFGTNSAF